jgi:hypothetical protein
MNRRTFIHSAGAAGMGLTGRLGLSEPRGSIAMLLKLLEDSPRERLPRELARLIHGGLLYEDLLAALSLAATRNVQPYPDVGFKYHSVMMLRSVHLTTQHLAAPEKWLPVIWAVDYFKDTQAQEQAASGWRMPAPVQTKSENSEVARRSLTAALDKWDHDAADAAIMKYAQSAPLDEIFALLFAYGARDLREIGHKAITISNAHSLMTLFGRDGGLEAAPILRSTVAALLNSEGEPDPATHDLAPDRPWRLNRERLQQIPRSWKQGHDDPAARADLRAALYRVSTEDAGKTVVEMLQRGISPDTIWQGLFDTAAELLMHEPGIVPLHAQTTANALHHAYRISTDEPAQQLALLQCAAFVALFRRMTNTSESEFNLQKLEPQPLEGHDPSQASREIFSDLAARHRVQAARKSLGYLRNGGDANSLIATARHHLVYGAMEAHDYKFAEALFDNYSQFPQAEWRSRFLSAGMGYFKAPTKRPVPIVAETIELLRANPGEKLML